MKSRKYPGLPGTGRFINTFKERTRALSKKKPTTTNKPKKKPQNRKLAQKKHDICNFRLQPVNSGSKYSSRLPLVPNYLPNW